MPIHRSLLFMASLLLGAMVSGTLRGELAVDSNGTAVAHQDREELASAEVTSTTLSNAQDSTCMYMVQVGAFHEYKNAQLTAGTFKQRCHYPVRVNRLPKDGHLLYKVMVGTFEERREALTTCKQLKAAGVEAFVTCAPLRKV